MIEYIIANFKTHNTKIKDLIRELDLYFNLIGVNLEATENNFFIKYAEILDPKILNQVNDYYNTILKNQERFPFLKKYLIKDTVPKENLLVDLFAGCGGLSLGLEQAGFNSVFVNELSPTYGETFFFNHSLPVSNYYIGDVNELIKRKRVLLDQFKNVDMVCGGPPCQGFSMANRQRIIDDPRNTLYRSFLEVLKYTTPKFFVMENVKGMLNKSTEISEDFKAYLGKDYNFSYHVFNAKNYGVPQSRERFILIGNRIGADSSEVIQEIIRNGKSEPVSLKEAINDLPSLSPKNIRNNNDIENEKFGVTFGVNKNRKANLFLKRINHDSSFPHIFNHKNRYNNERDIEIFSRLPQGANSLHPSITDIMPYASRNHMFKDKYFKLDENKVSKTITSHMKFDCNMYIHPRQSRGLSAREAARIQTFPDDYFFKGSQNSWYAQIGNAVPVLLAQAIGKAIKNYI